LDTEKRKASALGLTGSQEKAGACPNKMLALYISVSAYILIICNSQNYKLESNLTPLLFAKQELFLLCHIIIYISGWKIKLHMCSLCDDGYGEWSFAPRLPYLNNACSYPMQEYLGANFKIYALGSKEIKVQTPTFGLQFSLRC
jgi:hypothetical protein